MREITTEPTHLSSYYDFDEAVLESVEKVAAEQDGHSFRTLADKHGLAEGPTRILDMPTNGAIEVARFLPAKDHDETHARVYHLPMSMPVDASMVMRGMRLFEADPSEQLLLIGNPAAVGRPAGKLSLTDARTVWNGDLTPTVDPLLRYLHGQGITSIDSIGYSYGADKAATAAARGSKVYGIRTDKAVLMESAATENRGLLRLMRDFMSSGKQLQAAVDASKSVPYEQARYIADVGLSRYVGGLLRTSNIAIAHALAADSFEVRAANALHANPAMGMTIAWGTSSELARPDRMEAITDTLRQLYGKRVSAMVLKDMYHAGGDNINLHTAIVLQAFRLG